MDSGFEVELRGLLADVSEIRRSVGFCIPEAELSCAVGIGSDLWDRVFGRPRPSAHSHVALTTIVDDDGEERQIVRLNMPFGAVGAVEFGNRAVESDLRVSTLEAAAQLTSGERCALRPIVAATCTTAASSNTRTATSCDRS